MEKVILHAEGREEVGKSKAKKLRAMDLIPAVCYKDGKEPLKIKVKKRDLFKALHTKAGENALISLKIDDLKTSKEKLVLIKEIQTDPIKDDIIHVDFKEVSLTEEIKVKVPITSHGEAQDVIREGGIIEHVIWEIEVECLPTKIPEKVEADVSHMKIGDSVLIKDLKIPDGVKVLNDPLLVVFIAKLPKKEEIKVEAPPEAVEPEVIEKGKKVKEEEEEPAEEKAPPKKEEAGKKEEKKE